MDTLIAHIAETKANLTRGVRSFSMDYSSLSGRRFGAIPEWETRLSVNGHGAASLFRRRGPGDSSNEPPGRFTGHLDESSRMNFLEILAASGIQNYRSDAPGPRDPINILRVNLSGHIFRFAWSVSKSSMPGPMAQLKRLLAEWILTACPSAIWCLTLNVKSLEFKKGILNSSLWVENPGSDAIHIVNPSSPGFGPIFGFHLKYGEVQLIQEGYTPEQVDEKEAALPTPLLESPELIEVTPGHPFQIDFSAPLAGDAPRGWIGIFAFLHYLPDDTMAGLPIFNGALFTEELTW